MTRKQHRKWKKQNLVKKQEEEHIASDDRPEWADFEKEEESNENWRQNFLSEMRGIWSARLATT